MIKNGLYSLAAVAVVEVGGVLILHDGSCMAANPTAITPGPTTVPMASGKVK
jgi:hypothetical protein